MCFGRVLSYVAIIVIACSAGAYADQILTLALDPPEVGSSAGATDSQAVTKPAAKPETAQSAKPRSEARTTVGRVGIVETSGASIYRSRSKTAKKYSTVKADTPLAIVKEEGEWYGVMMINGATGWIPKSAVKMTGYELVSDKPDRSALASRGGALDRMRAFGEALVQTAMQYSGARYRFGGVNPDTGIDCSAFVRLVFSKHDIRLPRTAREQAQVGSTVPFDQLQPGDRLYFSCKNRYVDHCGIYAGGGYFVHSSASQGGVAVDLLSSDFYWRSLVVAKRS